MSSIGPTSQDPMIALAVLLVENDAVLNEIDQQNLEAAREAEREANARELESLHGAADAVARGAWLEGGFRIAGGATSAVALAKGSGASDAKADWQAAQVIGDGVSALAGPVSSLVGEVPRLHAEARARHAAQASDDARYRAEDALDHAEDVDRHANAVLELVQQIERSESEGNLAVLANV
jgi:hypothetical protein